MASPPTGPRPHPHRRNPPNGVWDQPPSDGCCWGKMDPQLVCSGMWRQMRRLPVTVMTSEVGVAESRARREWRLERRGRHLCSRRPWMPLACQRPCRARPRDVGEAGEQLLEVAPRPWSASPRRLTWAEPPCGQPASGARQQRPQTRTSHRSLCQIRAVDVQIEGSGAGLVQNEGRGHRGWRWLRGKQLPQAAGLGPYLRSAGLGAGGRSEQSRSGRDRAGRAAISGPAWVAGVERPGPDRAGFFIFIVKHQSMPLVVPVFC